jgi:hypothetical protein
MTRCSILHHVRDTVIRDQAARGAPKIWTPKKRCQVQLECNNGIRHRGLKEQLCLGSERTSGRIFRKALVLEESNLLSGFEK